MIRVRHLCGDL